MDLIRNITITFIRVFEFMLFARAIMSWFPTAGNNAIITFLYNVTEPLLAPVRKLLRKIPALQSLPIDFSIIALFLFLDILRILILTS